MDRKAAPAPPARVFQVFLTVWIFLSAIALFAQLPPDRWISVRIHPEDGALTPPAELLLRDPAGRRTGKDPRSEQSYVEIRSSSYEREAIDDAETGAPGPQTAIIDIRDPVEGPYVLEVIGTRLGTCSLELHSGVSRSPTLLTRLRTDKGTLHRYRIDYSSREGVRIQAIQRP